MKKAGKSPIVINVNFNNCTFKNNKVSSAEKRSFSIPTLLFLVFCVGALVVLRCCPELLPDYIRYFVSVAKSI